jgi:hypothetical protein
LLELGKKKTFQFFVRESWKREEPSEYRKMASSEADRAHLLEEFKAMTGTTDEFAISFLDSSDWKLEQAMELFLGGQGGVAQQTRDSSGGATSESGDEDMEILKIMEQHGVDRETAVAIREAGGGGSSQSSSAAAAGSVDADGVRAPILQKRARLFDTIEQEEGGMGYLAHDMRGLSVANAFDAQLRLARDMMAASAAGGAAASAESQRPSLFAPPRWMMFVGSFQDARAEAKAKKKWLMVNIQDQQEFQSLVLNRDLWSDDTTQTFIRESFVFWQQDRNAPEAAQFIHLYNPTQPFPHVCVIDPRTGERSRILKLKKKEADLRESFFDQITDFLDTSTFDATPKVRPSAPPASSSSLPQASLSGAATTEDADDKELAAAIQASLKVSEKSKSSTPPASAAAPSKQAAAAPSAAPAKPLPTFVPLEPEPAAGADATTIQFKFPDGSKAKRRFAKASPVSMLFAYVSQSQKVPTGARFDLLTGDVPARPLLAQIDQSLADADVLNQNLMVRVAAE